MAGKSYRQDERVLPIDWVLSHDPQVWVLLTEQVKAGRYVVFLDASEYHSYHAYRLRKEDD